MSLLTDKEIRKVLKPDYFFHGEENRVVARAQLCKVIEEIKKLEPFDHDTWNFGVAVRKWLERRRRK